jgi:acyl-CoA dehydrogenase
MQSFWTGARINPRGGDHGTGRRLRTVRRSYNVVYHDAVPSAELHHDLRLAVRDLCKAFPDSYWRELDAARAYPDAFVKALTERRLSRGADSRRVRRLGLGVAEASIILEEINRSGGNAGACHAQMYTMGTLLRHGSDAQKREYLPKIAAGELRLQAFGVTEPTTGSDTTQLKTTARRKGDATSSAARSLDLARGALRSAAARRPHDADRQVKKRTEGCRFCSSTAEGGRHGLTIRPIRTMMNHATTELFFDDLEVPVDAWSARKARGSATCSTD